MPALSTMPAPVLVASLFVVGCDYVDESPTDETFEFRSNEISNGPERGVWVNNGLEDPDVSGIDPAFALSSPQGILEDEALLIDPGRYDTVQYLVECALPADRTITKVVDGQELPFDGMLGLAPEWEDGACDEDCQEWVSACMLARTNLSGETVTIWMQADHPAIGMEPHLLYSTNEASFFGNLFAPSGSRNFCQGAVVGPLLAQLDGRTCSNVAGESCGFTKYMGCEVEARCEYESALPGLLGALLAPTAVGCTVDEHAFHTITTYVSPL